MARNLEDIIGYNNISTSGLLDVAVDLSTLTEYNKELSTGGKTVANAGTWIDFSRLGNSYNLQDLVGYGFDSTCCTCSNHYAIVFTNESVSSLVVENKDKILLIGLSAVGIETGTQLCKYIYDTINEYPEFFNHYTGYGYLDEKFWVYDHRPNQAPSIQSGHGLSYTSTYKTVTGIMATYVGPAIPVGQQYDPNDVMVYAEYTTGEAERLDPSEYRLSSLLVLNEGVNTYTATYIKNPDMQDEYEVISESLRLRCWYEGVKIEVGNAFDKHFVVVYRIDGYGIQLRVNVEDIDFIDETVIHKDGWNFYRLRLKDTEYKDVIGVYAVPGYDPLKTQKDIEFKVVYIDEENNYQEVDYTKHFNMFLYFDNILYISWDNFLEAVNELGVYGTYILTAPKKCGLSNKYDQDWEVLCIDKDRINAHILKNHYKEENETWQQRKQLQQSRKKWWKVPNET